MAPFPTRSAQLAAALVLAAGLAACASRPPPPPLPAQEGDQGFVPRGRQVFVSPMGEPFRADMSAAYPVAAWFAGADSNHDGRLTEAEFQADADRFFKRLDADGDGMIDGLEVQTYEREIAPEILPSVGRLRSGEGQNEGLFRPGGGARRGGGRNRGGDDAPQQRRVEAADRSAQGAGLYGFFQEPEPVSSADANFDGRVAIDEWRAKAARAFKRLDKTGAGYLILGGLPKTPQQEAIDKRRPPAAPR